MFRYVCRRVATIPRVSPRWYYATDHPVQKPHWFAYTQKEEPSKFEPFSETDNEKLEKALALRKDVEYVRQDELFQVNLEQMHISPVYWPGPVFEVRRSVWFGADNEPLGEEIDARLERAYTEQKPFAHPEKEPKTSKDEVARFNKQVKAKGNEASVLGEKGVVDLGDGSAAVFFNGTHGAIFPTNINSLQLNIIRNLGKAGGSLLNVKIIMRGLTKASKSPAEAPNEVEHLVLCVHGIGQILGTKYEAVDFTNSITGLRKTMQTVLKGQKRLQELAGGTSTKTQVLPILWRHAVTFQPKKVPEAVDGEGKPRLPSIDQINVDGVRPLRNVVGDVILDVLLYYEPRYLEEIFKVVVEELNRVYRLYKERNPNFSGKVHILGHSLGSAIMFDLLSLDKNPLDFEVENLFCVGSPVGMFKLLQQKNIKPFGKKDPNALQPRCRNLYNVFHPCDPVSYRMEPLVNPKFGNLKPEEVPFALDGFNTQVRHLTSLGDDVSEKIIQASGWFKKDLENPIGDILRSLTAGSDYKQKGKPTMLDEDELAPLAQLNRTGRIDYSLPTGVFSIALVSAIRAHISYFEDEETAGFLLHELLSCDKPRTLTRKAVRYLN